MLWFQIPPKPPRSAREPVLHDDTMRRELSLRVRSAGVSAEELMKRALARYLESDVPNPGQP